MPLYHEMSLEAFERLPFGAEEHNLVRIEIERIPVLFNDSVFGCWTNATTINFLQE